MTELQFNPFNSTYEYPDGTVVASELVDNVHCLLDVMYISIIRDKEKEHEHENR